MVEGNKRFVSHRNTLGKPNIKPFSLMQNQNQSFGAVCFGFTSSGVACFVSKCEADSVIAALSGGVKGVIHHGKM